MDYEDKIRRAKILEGLKIGQNTAQGQVLLPYADNVLNGLRLKKEFANKIGVPQSSLTIPNDRYEKMADEAGVEPNAYTYPGMMADSPELFAGEYAGRNELMLNEPMYKALLDELDKK